MSSVNEFKTTNERLARYIWKLINKRFKGRYSPEDEPLTIEGYTSSINEFLCTYKYLTDDERKVLTKNLTAQFKENCLSDDSLKWIDSKNERLCLWLWGYLRDDPFQMPDLQLEEDAHSDELQSLSEVLPSEMRVGSIADSILQKSDHQEDYIAFGLNYSYDTTQEHYRAIITYLDLLQASGREKERFNRTIKNLWKEVTSYGNFSWFVPQKKKEDDLWFFKYINQGLATYVQPEREPWDLSKAKAIAICRFDSWQADFPRQKEFFLKDMRKAWSQKKHRYKMKEDKKKPYSIVMHEDVNDKLEEMAKSTGMSKNEFLETLITNEYENSLYSKP